MNYIKSFLETYPRFLAAFVTSILCLFILVLVPAGKHNTVIAALMFVGLGILSMVFNAKKEASLRESVSFWAGFSMSCFGTGVIVSSIVQRSY
jgi:uncharacterized membrane protein YjjP (DUF1212 family)